MTNPWPKTCRRCGNEFPSQVAMDKHLGPCMASRPNRAESNRQRGTDEQRARVVSRYAYYMRPDELARYLVLYVGREMAHRLIEDAEATR